MNNGILEIQEFDHENGTPGHHIALTDIEFSPLGYAEFNNIHQPMNIPLVVHGKIIKSSVGSEIGQYKKISMSLKSDYTSKFIGLVKGGWLPSGIALHDNSIVLPDRCMVTHLKDRFKNGITKPQASKDFIDSFADSPVRINPCLFVLEGDNQQNPTREILEQNLEEAIGKIRSALPKAVLVELDLNNVLKLVEETQSSMVRKQNFLERLNRKLKSPVARQDIQARCDEILSEAEACCISKASLVVIAALSTVVIPNGRSPAKRLLKFDQGYTKAHAYNALSDLRSLELLMYSFAMFPDQHVMFCTTDKDLALFWIGLSASNFVFSGAGVTCDLFPENLLPDFCEKWRMLIAS
jgi:hypothetical protein